MQLKTLFINTAPSYRPKEITLNLRETHSIGCSFIVNVLQLAKTIDTCVLEDISISDFKDKSFGEMSESETTSR